VTLSLEPEGSAFFRLGVVDTGIGISPEDQPRLFTEFQQVGPARDAQGTGLGLALVKRIVEAQDGHVGMESAPGMGSVFFAVLPQRAKGARLAGKPAARELV
jgi:signal transduction histidine kinase